MGWLCWGRRLLLAVVGVAIAWNGVVVAVAPGRIPAVYGVPVDGAETAVLLRHRAVLLTLVGLVLVASAFRREVRSAAIPAAAVAMATFALFTFSADVDDRQRRVATADVVLLGLLAAAAVPERRAVQP